MQQTLQAAFEHTLSTHPSHGIHYVSSKGETTFQTYSELQHEALCVLAGLQKLNIQVGDPVIIALSDNREILPAFWACLLGGMQPTILSAPLSLYGKSPNLEKLEAVWNTLNAPHVLVDTGLLSHQTNQVMLAEVSLDKLQTFPFLKQSKPSEKLHTSKPSDVAFIQFSSGTTGAPKGVVLTHKNVTANLHAIGQVFAEHPQYDLQKPALNWLPLSHDMGLVGFHLEPLWQGNTQYQLNTIDFIKRPLMLLDLVERYQIAATAAPNFSQVLILDRLRKQADRQWDLSSLEIIYNGAEPISVSVMQSFLKELETSQLNPNVMLPVYGLAEATLAVSSPPILSTSNILHINRQVLSQERQAVFVDSEHPHALAVVSVGSPVDTMEVQIVSEKGRVLPDQAVGEIHIKGPSVSPGYYVAFDQAPHNRTEEWFITGDRGFLHQGELFITGRSKDVVFVNGQNFYAEDLESIAQDAIMENTNTKLAIGGIFDEEAHRDKVVLFMVGSNPANMVQRFLLIKRQIQRQAGLTLDLLVPLKASQLPKTSSGKIQRYRLRQRYEEGQYDTAIEKILPVLEEAIRSDVSQKVAPQTTTEKILHQICCEEMHMDPTHLGIYEEFTDLGVSSVRALQILVKLEQRYHMKLAPYLFAKYPNIHELSIYIDQHPMQVRKQEQVFGG